MLARGLKSITKASSSTGRRMDMQKYVSDSLGVTPGMRISSAKSDASRGVTGPMVPRHSLENDLVVSLNLLKTESGLLKARQLLCRASSPSSSSSRPLRARPAMSAQDQGSGQWPGRRDGRAGGRSYFMAPGEGDARPAGSAPSAPDAWEAALESAPPARWSRPPSRAARAGGSHRAGGAGSLSLAMPGAVRAIAQTRVSHHSEPARPQALPGTEAGARGRRAELVGGSGSLGGDRLSTRPRP